MTHLMKFNKNQEPIKKKKKFVDSIIEDEEEIQMEGAVTKLERQI